MKNTGGALKERLFHAYLPVMDNWLAQHGLPEIQIVTYQDKDGNRLTLEQECLRSGTLPGCGSPSSSCWGRKSRRTCRAAANPPAESR